MDKNFDEEDISSNSTDSLAQCLVALAADEINGIGTDVDLYGTALEALRRYSPSDVGRLLDSATVAAQNHPEQQAVEFAILDAFCAAMQLVSDRSGPSLHLLAIPLFASHLVPMWKVRLDTPQKQRLKQVLIGEQALAEDTHPQIATAILAASQAVALAHGTVSRILHLLTHSPEVATCDEALEALLAADPANREYADGDDEANDAGEVRSFGLIVVGLCTSANVLFPRKDALSTAEAKIIFDKSTDIEERTKQGRIVENAWNTFRETLAQKVGEALGFKNVELLGPGLMRWNSAVREIAGRSAVS